MLFIMYLVSTLNRACDAAPLASLLLVAQTTPPVVEEVRVSSHPYTPFRLRAESSLVQVNVVVRDRTGRAIPDLKQADFRLFEEGKLREIASFSVETRLGPQGRYRGR